MNSRDVDGHENEAGNKSTVIKDENTNSVKEPLGTKSEPVLNIADVL